MIEQAQKWSNDLNKVMQDAKKANKRVLLFFHSEMCSGCQKTISNTLPDKKVMESVGAFFVPAMFEMSEPAAQEHKKKYSIEWTPTFIVADSEGNEHYRWVGYLPANEFIAQLAMGEAKVALKREDVDTAGRCLSSIIEKFSDSDLVPEAIYYRGVTMYKKTKDVSHLNKAYDTLKSRFPDDIWTKKASVWAK